MKSPSDLKRESPKLREPLIDGVLRTGEIMNIIGAPKMHKSYLALYTALCVASGRDWLERFPVKRSVVLYFDNELHYETINDRLRLIAAAIGVDESEYADTLTIDCFRSNGELVTLDGIGSYMSRCMGLSKIRERVQDTALFVIDAWYKFLPPDTDENDNGAMCRCYAELEKYCPGIAKILVHHSSKGSQAGKAVTDVGAGAGAQSRAADCHLILRQHEEPNAVAVEAEVRSWPPLKPFCLRWDYPVWNPDDNLDPAAIKVDRKRKRKDKPERATWTPESFVGAFCGAEPKAKASIIQTARSSGLSSREATRQFQAAVDAKLLVPSKGEDRRQVLYSSAA